MVHDARAGEASVVAAGKVCDAFIPDAAVAELSPGSRQQRMQSGPAGFRIPKPERGLRQCLFRPRSDMRTVAVFKTGHDRLITGEA